MGSTLRRSEGEAEENPLKPKRKKLGSICVRIAVILGVAIGVSLANGVWLPDLLFILTKRAGENGRNVRLGWSENGGWAVF